MPFPIIPPVILFKTLEINQYSFPNTSQNPPVTYVLLKKRLILHKNKFIAAKILNFI